jgi:hypothetical protein
LVWRPLLAGGVGMGTPESEKTELDRRGPSKLPLQAAGRP